MFKPDFLKPSMYLGNVIPSIGQVFKVQTTCIRLLKVSFFLSYSRFGTWKIPVGRETTDQVDQAISVGFSHIGEFISRPEPTKQS